MDPLVTAVIAFGFAVLFGTAAMTKLRNFERFRSALRNYALFPSSLETVVSVMIVFVEIVLAIGWLLGFYMAPTAIASALLLGLYGAGMATNLVRARSYIDCGCGRAEQPLSWALVVRNALYMTAALAVLIPANERTLGWFDMGLATFALLILVLMERTAMALLANMSQTAAWRT